MKSPVVLLSSLFHDVKRLEPGVKGLDRDLNTIKFRFEHEGYGFLTISLPRFCDSLDRGLADGEYTCPLGFAKRGALPKFLSGLLCAVFDIQTGLILKEPSIHSVKCLREICRVFKKLIYSESREDILHKAAVDEFTICDSLIPDDISSPEFDYYISRVSTMVLQGLNQYDPRELKGKHGPGSVAEGYSPNQKWNGLIADMVYHDRYASYFGYDITVFRGIGDQDRKSSYLTECKDSLCGTPTGIAKLISVPKSSVARRTISMEPVLKQFIQQGLNTALRDSISGCVILRECLALTNQTRNQLACLEGSRTGELATIDLSSASDRLSLRLVEKIFSSKALFLEDLKGSRSSGISFDKKEFTLKKYAGMGNATTFPVQSVAFALLAICSILQQDSLEPSYWNCKRASRLLRVFGDDIVIPSKYVASLDRWLTYYGLKINHKKSFSTGFFRESCGVDAFHGRDVTPIYVKEWPTLQREKSKLIPHLVAAANSFWSRGLYAASDCIRAEVEAIVGSLPCVSVRSEGLGWHSRVDTNVAQKWDGKLQRFVFRTLVVKGSRSVDKLNGHAALLKSLHSLETRRCDSLLVRDSKNLESSPKRFRNRLRWRWLPANAG